MVDRSIRRDGEVQQEDICVLLRRIEVEIFCDILDDGGKMANTCAYSRIVRCFIVLWMAMRINDRTKK